MGDRLDALRAYARQVLDPDEGVARGAVAALRAAGPPGLQALAAVHGAPPRPAPERVRAAFDAVCAQHGGRVSRMYWHTDLDAALAAARARGRPVLTLRLTGRLDEPHCGPTAGVVRDTLYANARVAAVLRARFVLHWRSVGAVDPSARFGDGAAPRCADRDPVAHYVLDATGRAVDCVPGLYHPLAFLRALASAAAVAREVAAASDREHALRRAHQRRLEDLFVAWCHDLRLVGRATAARRAVGVLARERRVVPALDALASAMDDGLWGRLGWERWGRRVLAWTSARRSTSRSEVRTIPDATGRRAAPGVPREFCVVRETGVDGTGADTAWNEYALRRHVREHFVTGEAAADVEALNAWVFANVF